jgi:type IV secretory pathway VirB2 component (pilin)
MSWFGALWMIICIGIALAFGKAGFPRISGRLMPCGR